MPNQQQVSVQPQAAFEELARIRLADHSMETVMAAIAVLAKRTIPGADEVSVTLVEGGKATTLAYTGELARDLDERQYDRGYGPCLDGIAGGQPVHIVDLATDTRWRDWAAEAARRGAGSSLSMPVPLQREVSAALNIYAIEAGAFDDDAVALAQAFAAYAGVALANMHLYEAQGRVAEQLQAAMTSRAVIEQAKGILMGQHACTAEQAFERLVRTSQVTNRKLRDVAQGLVDDPRSSIAR